ncbi:MAG: alpha/beta hydrolase-fold protein [Terriglobia bacterium]
MKSEMPGNSLPYRRSSPGVNRREVLRLLGTCSVGAPIATAFSPIPAQAAGCTPPESGQIGSVHFNSCGMTREPKKFTGPFKVQNTTYIINSHNQSYDLPLRVLLPDKMEEIDSPRVLYVLPAEPGIGLRWGDGLLEVEQQNLHNRYGLIAVSPSFSDWPWYANHPTNPEIQQETYFIEEIVPFIDGLYPKASRKRLLVGLSKSGNGAYQLLLRHPELFLAASICDSPIMCNVARQFGMADIYGDQRNFDKYCIPQLLRKQTDLFRGKPPRLALFGYCLFGGPNPMYGPHIEEAHALMENLGIPHIYEDSICRDHRWDSGWLEAAVAALDNMSRSKL